MSKIIVLPAPPMKYQTLINAAKQGISSLFILRYDIQHNDSQHNDIQHNDKQRSIQHNDIQHNGMLC